MTLPAEPAESTEEPLIEAPGVVPLPPRRGLPRHVPRRRRRTVMLLVAVVLMLMIAIVANNVEAYISGLLCIWLD